MSLLAQVSTLQRITSAHCTRYSAYQHCMKHEKGKNMEQNAMKPLGTQGSLNFHFTRFKTVYQHYSLEPHEFKGNTFSAHLTRFPVYEYINIT